MPITLDEAMGSFLKKKRTPYQDVTPESHLKNVLHFERARKKAADAGDHQRARWYENIRNRESASYIHKTGGYKPGDFPDKEHH